VSASLTATAGPNFELEFGDDSLAGFAGIRMTGSGTADFSGTGVEGGCSDSDGSIEVEVKFGPQISVTGGGQLTGTWSNWEFVIAEVTITGTLDLTVGGTLICDKNGCSDFLKGSETWSGKVTGRACLFGVCQERDF
jgi:hypothetical protein